MVRMPPLMSLQGDVESSLLDGLSAVLHRGSQCRLQVHNWTARSRGLRHCYSLFRLGWVIWHPVWYRRCLRIWRIGYCLTEHNLLRMRFVRIVTQHRRAFPWASHFLLIGSPWHLLDRLCVPEVSGWVPPLRFPSAPLDFRLGSDLASSLLILHLVNNYKGAYP